MKATVGKMSALLVCFGLLVVLLGGCGGMESPVGSGDVNRDATGLNVAGQQSGNAKLIGDIASDGTKGTIIRVPANFPKIQGAIDAATTGATIIVSRGTYNEALDFHGKAITLQSTNPASRATVQATIINGTSTLPVILVKSVAAGSMATIKGLTITGGLRGVFCQYAALTLDSCIVRDNMKDGVYFRYHSSGAIQANWIEKNWRGIYLEESSTPTISNNTVELNGDRGIYVYQSAAPTITGNTIQYNAGGILCKWAVITGNTIVNNTSTDHGGGISCSETPTIANNLIAGNTASYGGGVYCTDSAVFTNDTICHNTAKTGIGGNLRLATASPIITNCIIAFAKSGGGIAGTGSPRVSYSDVYGNTGGDYVGVTSTMPGNISRDALFVSTGATGAYRLKSTGGHWNGSAWVVDTVTSPCVNTGDRTSPYALEPAPNGGRINMGYDGNTPFASKSPR